MIINLEINKKELKEAYLQCSKSYLDKDFSFGVG